MSVTEIQIMTYSGLCIYVSCSYVRSCNEFGSLIVTAERGALLHLSYLSAHVLGIIYVLVWASDYSVSSLERSNRTQEYRDCVQALLTGNLCVPLDVAPEFLKVNHFSITIDPL